jgi:hypothetical protein
MRPKYEPYTPNGYAWMNPKGLVKFSRRCFIWQGIKFAYYNIKIMAVLAKGHGGH